MKHRILAIVALLCAVGVFIAPSAIADDLTDVGTVAQSAIASLPAFVSANRQLSAIASQMQQQEAAQMKGAKNDAQRQQIQLQFSQRFNDKQNEILGPLLQRVQLALAAVSAKRKLSVVVDRHIVVYGGQDITTDVLNLVTGTQAIPPVTATPPPSSIGYVDQSVLDSGLPKVKAANDAFAKFAQQQRADRRPTIDNDVRLQQRAFADGDIFPDHAVGADLRASADARFGMDDSGWMNHRFYAVRTDASAPYTQGSGAMENISSAEQTYSPSTLASASTHPILRRWRVKRTSIISRSPGMTGRRNFA